eukprot:TRINITY_DN4202_c0_g2_i5.p2 TRINITY_DN4202_c0_g2~~TRINITY_DN4202_c0_g2_i5.p2  ORF type:complete len:169 (-),score=3.37 TRINITY_DN4202_c0_g2_i5:193-699(-)
MFEFKTKFNGCALQLINRMLNFYFGFQFQFFFLNYFGCDISSYLSILHFQLFEYSRKSGSEVNCQLQNLNNLYLKKIKQKKIFYDSIFLATFCIFNQLILRFCLLIYERSYQEVMILEKEENANINVLVHTYLLVKRFKKLPGRLQNNLKIQKFSGPKKQKNTINKAS